MKGVDRSPVTAPGHVWICSAAVTADGAQVVARKNAGKPGFERFTPCGFSSPDFDAAREHADDMCGAHRVYEHPHGNRNEKPRRSMHGSDSGGAYINDVEGWRPDEPQHGVF